MECVASFPHLGGTARDFPPSSYLRVHRDEAETRDARTPSPESAASLIDPPNHVDDFWRVYTEATGWQVNEDGQLQDATVSSAPDALHRSDTLPDPLMDSIASSTHASEMTDGSDENNAVEQRLPAVQARRLADAAARLAAQLQSQQKTLQKQQTELAVRAVDTAPTCRAMPSPSRSNGLLPTPSRRLTPSPPPSM